MNRRQKIVQQRFIDDETRVIKRLDQVYTQALKDIDGNIEKLMKRFDPETGDLPQSAIYQLKYQKMLRAQVDDELTRLHKNGYLTVSDYLDDCYTNGFIGSMYDMHGQGVPLAMPIDKDAMVHAVQLDSNISQGMYSKMGVDVQELRNRITMQVSRGIATGASWPQVAKQLNGEMRIGYNKAVRIARTEGHRIQNQAKMDAMDDATERGADLVKQWDATLDGKTRDSHAAVDGEFREKDEEFSNGLQFPGDPHGAAGEVINCRCALLMRARWAVSNGFTKMNNFTKQLETFESPEAYDEFKEGFFSPENKQYMNYVQTLEKRYNTRDFPTILERMNEREYGHYSKLLDKNPLYNSKALENSGNSDIIELEDIRILRGIGAKAQNYDILDLTTGEYFHFVEGTRIQNAEVFAGYKVKKPLKKEVAEGLAAEFGGDPAKWQHAKGFGVIDYYGDEVDAEVHWFQEETVGKVKFKVKRWIDDEG